MWEIPFYLIYAPIITLVVSIFCSLRYKSFWPGPLAVFVVLNIPTVIVSIMYHAGLGGLVGWAAFYTAISVLITSIVLLVRKKR